eukprot:SAG31_NODE_23986_length_491_cov_1.441327_1_plen_106_part_01
MDKRLGEFASPTTGPQSPDQEDFEDDFSFDQTEESQEDFTSLGPREADALRAADHGGWLYLCQTVAGRKLKVQMRPKFSRRWCELHGGRLSYYKRPGGKEKGRIDL